MTEIQKTLAVPASPIGTEGEWEAIETALCIELPEDYKQFISQYGTGTIGYVFEVLNLLENTDVIWNEIKFVRDQNEAVFAEAKNVAELMGRKPRDVTKPLPFQFFPEKGGLLPWARASDGWTFWWFTNGRPCDWKIVSTFNATEDYKVFNSISTVDFLVALLSSKFDINLGLSPVFVAKSKN